MKTFELKDFIKTKNNAKKHAEEEINFFVKNLDNFNQEKITAWLRAVKKHGLDDDEVTNLTLAMAKSGAVLSWEELEPTIDKHSSGGIGDKITLLFAPLIAAYGINFPKLSGRSLGITGGTIDKLESIKGLKTNLSIKEIKEQVTKIKLAISAATNNLAPADKKLYAIRNVTGTIDSIPLIASSIMSKKIAGGARNIILDVKAGSGAFMKDTESASILAKKMVAIGKRLDRNTKALITNMDEPLGHNIGNSLEIIEVLEILSGKEVGDLIEITIRLAREAIILINGNVETHRGMSSLDEKLQRLLLRGDALKKFEELINMQGGDLNNGFKKADYVELMRSNYDGIIQEINANVIGEIVFELGAGRKNINDSIDHSVGIVLLKKTEDLVKRGESLIEVHAKSKQDVDIIKDKLLSAIKIGNEKPKKQKLIYEVLS